MDAKIVKNRELKVLDSVFCYNIELRHAETMSDIIGTAPRKGKLQIHENIKSPIGVVIAE